MQAPAFQYIFVFAGPSCNLDRSTQYLLVHYSSLGCHSSCLQFFGQLPAAVQLHGVCIKQ